jgi:probable phosphoglycerate mutase
VPIFSSDLLRARETAEIVGEVLGSSVAMEPGLRELSYGVAEGQPKAWLDEQITPTHGPRLDHHVCEGAESRRDIATRVYAAMNGVLTSDRRDLVIVTHGFAATFVMACWIGLPIESVGYVAFAASPAGISLLVEDDVFRNRIVSCLNDTRHLD